MWDGPHVRRRHPARRHGLPRRPPCVAGRDRDDRGAGPHGPHRPGPAPGPAAGPGPRTPPSRRGHAAVADPAGTRSPPGRHAGPPRAGPRRARRPAGPVAGRPRPGRCGAGPAGRAPRSRGGARPPDLARRLQPRGARAVRRDAPAQHAAARCRADDLLAARPRPGRDGRAGRPATCPRRCAWPTSCGGAGPTSGAGAARTRTPSWARPTPDPSLGRPPRETRSDQGTSRTRPKAWRLSM